MALFAIERANEETLELIDGRPVWIHVDWDVLEPGYIPAAYRVGEGMLPHQIAAIFAALPAGSVRGIELAEFEAGDAEVPEHVSVELILGDVEVEHVTLAERRLGLAPAR